MSRHSHLFTLTFALILVVLFASTLPLGVQGQRYEPYPLYYIPAVPQTFYFKTPTPRPTEFPEIFSWKGYGDEIVRLPPSALNRRTVLYIEYTGEQSFIIWTYDANNERQHLLVNEYGSYWAFRALNFDKHFNSAAKLWIQSTGPWRMTLYDLLDPTVPKVSIPGSVQGYGSRVIGLKGMTPGSASFQFHGEGFSIVYSYNDQIMTSALASGYGGYFDSAILPADTTWLEIDADGKDWSIDITEQ